MFDKNGVPLKDAYHQKTLDVDEGFLGRIYYGKAREERIERQKRMERFFERHWLIMTSVACCGSLCLLKSYECIKEEVAAYNQKQEEKERAKAAAQAAENKQQATLTKVSGDIALFDVNGDKKTDYIVQNLTISDRVFLNENEEQTRTIGSWKGNLSQKALFMKYNHLQKERE